MDDQVQAGFDVSQVLTGIGEMIVAFTDGLDRIIVKIDELNGKLATLGSGASTQSISDFQNRITQLEQAAQASNQRIATASAASNTQITEQARGELTKRISILSAYEAAATGSDENLLAKRQATIKETITNEQSLAEARIKLTQEWTSSETSALTKLAEDEKKKLADLRAEIQNINHDIGLIRKPNPSDSFQSDAVTSGNVSPQIGALTAQKTALNQQAKELSTQIKQVQTDFVAQNKAALQTMLADYNNYYREITADARADADAKIAEEQRVADEVKKAQQQAIDAAKVAQQQVLADAKIAANQRVAEARLAQQQIAADAKAGQQQSIADARAAANQNVADAKAAAKAAQKAIDDANKATIKDALDTQKAADKEIADSDKAKNDIIKAAAKETSSIISQTLKTEIALIIEGVTTEKEAEDAKLQIAQLIYTDRIEKAHQAGAVELEEIQRVEEEYRKLQEQIRAEDVPGLQSRQQVLQSTPQQVGTADWVRDKAELDLIQAALDRISATETELIAKETELNQKRLEYANKVAPIYQAGGVQTAYQGQLVDDQLADTTVAATNRINDANTKMIDTFRSGGGPINQFRSSILTAIPDAMTGASKSIEGFGQLIESQTQRIGGAAFRLAAGFAPLGFAFVSAATQGVAFEKQLALVGTQMDTLPNESIDQFQQRISNLGDSLLATSSKFGVSAQDLAKSMYFLFSGTDVDPAQAADLSKKLADQLAITAVGNNVNPSDVIQPLDVIINTFGHDAMNAYKQASIGAQQYNDLADYTNHALDVLVDTVKKSNGEMSTLLPNIGKFADYARNAGASLEESLMTYATISRVVPPDQAGTFTENLFKTMDTPKFEEAATLKMGISLYTIDFSGNMVKKDPLEVLQEIQDKIKGLNLSQQEVALKDLFPNTRSMQGAQIVLDNLQTIQKNAEDAAKGLDDLKKSQYDLVDETVAQKFARIQNIFTNTGIQVFQQGFEVQIKQGLDLIVSIIQSFGSLDSVLQHNAATWAGLALVIPVVMITLSGLGLLLGGLITVLGAALNPMSLFFASILKLQISTDLFTRLGAAFKASGDELQRFGEKSGIVQELAVTLAGLFVAFNSGNDNAFNSAVNALTKLGISAGDARNILNEVKDNIGTFGQDINKAVTSIKDFISQLEGLFNNIKGIVGFMMSNSQWFAIANLILVGSNKLAGFIGNLNSFGTKIHDLATAMTAAKTAATDMAVATNAANDAVVLANGGQAAATVAIEATTVKVGGLKGAFAALKTFIGDIFTVFLGNIPIVGSSFTEMTTKMKVELGALAIAVAGLWAASDYSNNVNKIGNSQQTVFLNTYDPKLSQQIYDTAKWGPLAGLGNSQNIVDYTKNQSNAVDDTAQRALNTEFVAQIKDVTTNKYAVDADLKSFLHDYLSSSTNTDGVFYKQAQGIMDTINQNQQNFISKMYDTYMLSKANYDQFKGSFTGVNGVDVASDADIVNQSLTQQGITNGLDNGNGITVSQNDLISMGVGDKTSMSAALTSAVDADLDNGMDIPTLMTKYANHMDELKGAIVTYYQEQVDLQKTIDAGPKKMIGPVAPLTDQEIANKATQALAQVTQFGYAAPAPAPALPHTISDQQLQDLNSNYGFDLAAAVPDLNKVTQTLGPVAPSTPLSEIDLTMKDDTIQAALDNATKYQAAVASWDKANTDWGKQVTTYNKDVESENTSYARAVDKIDKQAADIETKHKKASEDLKEQSAALESQHTDDVAAINAEYKTELDTRNTAVAAANQQETDLDTQHNATLVDLQTQKDDIILGKLDDVTGIRTTALQTIVDDEINSLDALRDKFNTTVESIKQNTETQIADINTAFSTDKATSYQDLLDKQAQARQDLIDKHNEQGVKDAQKAALDANKNLTPAQRAQAEKDLEWQQQQDDLKESQQKEITAWNTQEATKRAQADKQIENINDQAAKQLAAENTNYATSMAAQVTASDAKYAQQQATDLKSLGAIDKQISAENVRYDIQYGNIQKQRARIQTEYDAQVAATNTKVDKMQAAYKKSEDNLTESINAENLSYQQQVSDLQQSSSDLVTAHQTRLAAINDQLDQEKAAYQSLVDDVKTKLEEINVATYTAVDANPVLKDKYGNMGQNYAQNYTDANGQPMNPLTEDRYKKLAIDNNLQYTNAAGQTQSYDYNNVKFFQKTGQQELIAANNLQKTYPTDDALYAALQSGELTPYTGQAMDIDGHWYPYNKDYMYQNATGQTQSATPVDAAPTSPSSSSAPTGNTPPPNVPGYNNGGGNVVLPPDPALAAEAAKAPQDKDPGMSPPATPPPATGTSGNSTDNNPTSTPSSDSAGDLLGVGGPVITTTFGGSDAAYPDGGHPGVDISTPIGTPLYAPEDMTVIGSVSGMGNTYKNGKGTPSYGNYLLGQMANGDYIMMGHLKETSAVNSKFKKGDEIATSGNSGFSTGPHVHLEIRKAGKASDYGQVGNMNTTVDPLSYPGLFGGNNATIAGGGKVATGAMDGDGSVPIPNINNSDPNFVPGPDLNGAGLGSSPDATGAPASKATVQKPTGAQDPNNMLTPPPPEDAPPGSPSNPSTPTGTPTQSQDDYLANTLAPKLAQQLLDFLYGKKQPDNSNPNDPNTDAQGMPLFDKLAGMNQADLANYVETHYSEQVMDMLLTQFNKMDITELSKEQLLKGIEYMTEVSGYLSKINDTISQTKIDQYLVSIGKKLGDLSPDEIKKMWDTLSQDPANFKDPTDATKNKYRSKYPGAPDWVTNPQNEEEREASKDWIKQYDQEHPVANDTKANAKTLDSMKNEYSQSSIDAAKATEGLTNVKDADLTTKQLNDINFDLEGDDTNMQGAYVDKESSTVGGSYVGAAGKEQGPAGSPDYVRNPTNPAAWRRRYWWFVRYYKALRARKLGMFFGDPIAAANDGNTDQPQWTEPDQTNLNAQEQADYGKLDEHGNYTGSGVAGTGGNDGDHMDKAGNVVDKQGNLVKKNNDTGDSGQTAKMPLEDTVTKSINDIPTIKDSTKIAADQLTKGPVLVKSFDGSMKGLDGTLNTDMTLTVNGTVQGLLTSADYDAITSRVAAAIKTQIENEMNNKK